MIVDRRNGEPNDHFPVGMRVLAVDDNPICLKLLEQLLRKCQYHVTTRDRAIDALRLLRENKDLFDLVISDVHMPDMDGFKLLELVGLEMDLPVIMLSANGDTKLVMKGITHGACDYLLKPVRLKELQNIWQHVIRRKNFERKGQSNSDNQEKRSGQAVHGQGGTRISNSDKDAKLGKRRKDPVEDYDDEEIDENGHNNEDPSSQKKARVVWSVELHRKFVAAVNQLGFERAVPKKILELMNVEKLTRENVASHLQKYRLFLKRLSSVANQQANMVAALGDADSSFMHMNSMNFHNFKSPGQFQNNSLRSLSPSGMLGRLNSPANLGLNGLSPPGISPLSPIQMSRNSIADSSKFQSNLLLGDQTNNVLQGMPTSLEFDQLQLQHRKGIMGVGRDFSSSSGNPGIFPNGYLEANKNATSSSITNPLSNLSNGSLLLQEHSLESQTSQEHFGNHPSSMVVIPFDSSSSFSLPDQTQYDGNWASGIQSSGFQSNPFPPNSSYSLASVQTMGSRNNGSSSMGLSGGVGLDDSRFDMQSQTTLVGDNLDQRMGYPLNQTPNNNNMLDMSHLPGLVNSSMNYSMVSSLAAGCLTQTLDPRSSLFNASNGFGLIGQSSLDSSSTQLSLPEMSGMELNREFLTEQGRSLGSFSANGAGSLEDVVNLMNRWESNGATIKRGGDLGSGMYPMRTCI